MQKLTKTILVATLVLAAGCLSVSKVDNAPVATLDLNRYLGEWYEIARFDHSFERGVEQAKANYTQNADGTIKVVNSGIYSHALVGSGSADYLWILSRTPGLPETAKSELLYEARRRGYDTDKLIWVKQK